MAVRPSRYRSHHRLAGLVVGLVLAGISAGAVAGYLIARAESGGPRLGHAGLYSSVPFGPDLIQIHFAVNTVFSSAHDDKAFSPSYRRHFHLVRAGLDGKTATAWPLSSASDLRGNGADGSYYGLSAWKTSYIVDIPPPSRANGTDRLTVTACVRQGHGCQSTVVPLCVKDGKIIGEPGSVGDGLVRIGIYDGSASWWRDNSCTRAAWGGTTLDATSEPSG